MDVVSYKCPNCAAPLAFDIGAQQWNCEFCLGSFTLEQLSANGQSEEGRSRQSAVEEQKEGNEETYGGEAVVYTCPSCGGRLVTDETTTASFCTYCHNPAVIVSRLEGERRPAKILPFQLEKEEALEKMRKLCRRRPLLPKDFQQYAEKGEITGLYVPFWLNSCTLDAKIQGQGKRIQTWSDRDYRYTKTDTYYVQRDATMAFENIPADGSSKMDDQLMQGLEPFDYGRIASFEMEYLSGHFAETYDVDAATAAAVAFARMDGAVNRKMREQVQGYTSFHMKELSTGRRNVRCEYVLLPVWVLMATYREKRYIFAMNGQSGKMVGKLPLSLPKALLWFGGIFTAVFAAALLCSVLY